MGAGLPEGPQRSAEVLAEYLADSGIVHEPAGGGWPPGAAVGPGWVVALPGTAKLRTNVSMLVGARGIVINAFVCRAPAENHEQVYRLILRRNPRLAGIAFGLDRLGDIYLTGVLPHAAVSPEEIDRLLGVVLGESDGMFNQLVRVGFAGAIAREQAWRDRAGLDDANLRALRESP